jgi:hypothetical protein
MYHPVSNCTNLVHILNASVLRVDQYFQNQFHSCGVIRQILLDYYFVFAQGFMFQSAAGNSYPVYQTNG